MKKIIFLDANIYLNFLDSNKPELKRLLDSLRELKNNIFISSQIVDEVNRNKLLVAKNSLINYFDNLSGIKSTNLPEHLEMEGKSFQTWNSQSKDFYLRQKELQQELVNLIHKTLKEIMLSTDKVSITFEFLSEDALKPSESEMKAARNRREVGNPPGKSSNPLGDQISWEQFLSHSLDAKYVWIITKDSDFCTTFKNKRYLNPVLHNELIKNNISASSIFCFASLAEGLKHFNEISLEKIENLPIEEELNNIIEEELYNFNLPKVTSFGVCSVCKSTSLFQFTRTVYGSWIDCLKCRDCGNEVVLDIVYMD